MNRSHAKKSLSRCIISVLAFGCFVWPVHAGDSTRQVLSVSIGEKQMKAGKDSVVVKDGIYVGVSEGWTGMKTEVTIQKGQISGIKILEISGTPEFYKKVVGLLPDRILSKGSLEVDGVSGATLSSNSMKEAVGHALEKARQSQ
jgi:uncharacterized protein with FMN-binding domain